MGLTVNDYDLVIESLEYTRHKFEEYRYPTHEYKQARISEVNSVLSKVREMRKQAKAELVKQEA